MGKRKYLSDIDFGFEIRDIKKNENKDLIIDIQYTQPSEDNVAYDYLNMMGLLSSSIIINYMNELLVKKSAGDYEPNPTVQRCKMVTNNFPKKEINITLLYMRAGNYLEFMDIDELTENIVKSVTKINNELNSMIIDNLKEIK